MEAGCDPARFWTVTPAVAAREMRGMATRRTHESQRDAWLAWHIEALARTKKLPPLKDMMGGKKRRTNGAQDREILLANLKLAFGFTGETKQ